MPDPGIRQPVGYAPGAFQNTANQDRGWGAQPGTGPNATDAQGPFGPANWSANPNTPYGSPDMWYGNPYAMDYNMFYDSQYGPQQQNLQTSIDNQWGDFSNSYRGYQEGANTAYGMSRDANGNLVAGGLPDTMQFNPNEQSGIMQTDMRTGSMTTGDQYSQMGRTTAENAAISGDPYAAYNTFAQQDAGSYNDQGMQEDRTFDALGEQDANLRGLGEGYQKSTAGIMDTTGTGMRNAAYSQDQYQDPNFAGKIEGTLGQDESNVRDIYQDPNLQVSGDFMSDYKFGPQDTQDLEALAGTAVGNRYRGQMDAIQRQAAAQGQTSPAALAAIEGRSMRQSAQDAADAAISARTQGRQMELSTTKGREDERLGALQTQAGMGVNSELSLANQRLNAETESEQMRQGAAQKADALQVGAEQQIGQMGLQTAGDVAGYQGANERAQSAARIGAYNTLGAQRQNLNQFTTTGMTNTQGAAEAAASGRAMNIADERTAQARANANMQFSQGQTVAGSLSQSQQDIANKRLAGEQERRGYQTGMTGLTSQGMMTSAGQAQNNYNARTGAGNQAASGYGGYDVNRRNIDANAKNPSDTTRLINTATGFAGGALKP